MGQEGDVSQAYLGAFRHRTMDLGRGFKIPFWIRVTSTCQKEWGTFSWQETRLLVHPWPLCVEI